MSNRKQVSLSKSLVITIIIVSLIVAATVFILIKYNKKTIIRDNDTDDTSSIINDESDSDIITQNENMFNGSEETSVSDISDTETDTDNIEHLPSPGGEQKLTSKTITQNDSNIIGKNGTFSISYPVIDNSEYGEKADQFNVLITGIVDTIKNDYLTVLSDSDTDIDYEVSYNTNKNSDGIISVLFIEILNLGGAHPSTVYKTVNFALPSGTELFLADQFGGVGDYKSTIANIVYEKICENPDLYYEDVSVQKIIDLFDEKNYYITDKGITVFFNEYDLAPHAAGISEFQITYSQMSSHIIY